MRDADTRTVYDDIIVVTHKNRPVELGRKSVEGTFKIRICYVRAAARRTGKKREREVDQLANGSLAPALDESVEKSTQSRAKSIGGDKVCSAC